MVARRSGCFIIAALFISPADDLLELITCIIAVHSPTNLIYRELMLQIYWYRATGWEVRTQLPKEDN